MKTFILIASLSLTTLFIALPIEYQEGGDDRPSHRAPIDDDVHDKEPWLNDSQSNRPKLHDPTTDAEVDGSTSPEIAAQLAISEDRFHEVSILCTNFCQLAQECNDRGIAVPADGGFTNTSEQHLRGNIQPEKRSASDYAVSKLATTISPACVGNSRHYDISNKEQLKSALSCQEQALQQMSSKERPSIGMEIDKENCCGSCVAKMNSQYRLASECGKKLEQLVLCLASSRSCTTLQWFFSSDRNRVRRESDPDYPCRECVEAFKYSCGKG